MEAAGDRDDLCSDLLNNLVKKQGWISQPFFLLLAEGISGYGKHGTKRLAKVLGSWAMLSRDGNQIGERQTIEEVFK